MEVYIVKQESLDEFGKTEFIVGAYSNYEKAIKAIKDYDPMHVGAKSKIYKTYKSATTFTKTGYSITLKRHVTVYVNSDAVELDEPLR